MKERMARVLVFSSCTTAPLMAVPLPSVTVPCTERWVASSFFSCLSAAPAWITSAIVRAAPNRKLRITKTRRHEGTRAARFVDNRGPAFPCIISNLLPILLLRRHRGILLLPLLPPRQPIPAPEDRSLKL